MKLRRTGRTSMLLVVAALACSDHDPAAPDLALEPSNYIKPYTGAACGESNCLPGNVIGGWNITTGYSSSYTFTPWNVDARTERGSSITAGFCITRKSDGYSLGCQMIENWSQAGPYLGTGAVKIVGMDVQNRHRLYFDGFAPRPTIELLEFDRPETVSCNTTTQECTGPFRLKIDLRNSDWYRADHIYLYTVMPDGTELYLQPDYVRSGTTFEWTWTRLRGPGYRLLVRYRPWEGSDDWMVELSVPISDASPELTLEALESPGGPAVTQVPAGTSVFFTASAPGATSIDSLRWQWTPSDPTVTPQTAACAPDEISCTVAVHEDGTMHVAARVDGQTREATANVSTIQPAASLSCNDPIRGTTIRCEVSSVGGADVTVLGWRFTSPGFPTNTQAGPQSVWDGTAVRGGVAEVDVLVNGVAAPPLTDSVQVAPRQDGIWAPTHWATQMSFVQGQGTPSCFVTNRVMGLDPSIPGSGRLGFAGAPGPVCSGFKIVPSSQSGGYSIAEGTGPNAGMWYIADLRLHLPGTSQLHPEAFPNAPTSGLSNPQQETLCRTMLSVPAGTPVAVNFYTFNGTCKGVSNWGSFLNAAWAHERQHYDQGVTEALKPQNNVYLELEDVVRGSINEVATQVGNTVGSIEQQVSLAADNPHPTGNWSTLFWIWQSDTQDEFVTSTTPFAPRQQ